MSKCDDMHLNSFLRREIENIFVGKLSFEEEFEVEENEREVEKNIVGRCSGHRGSEVKCRHSQFENLVLSRMWNLAIKSHCLLKYNIQGLQGQECPFSSA